MEEGKKNIDSGVFKKVLCICFVVILALTGYIVYDKFLKKDDSSKPAKCECDKTTIDYTAINIDTAVPLVCTIDMTGLTEVEVATKCGEDFDIKNSAYQIRVENLKYNDTKYTYTYILEKDTRFPRDDDDGIVKMYIGNTLIDAHAGATRDIFNTIKINGNVLHIEEGARTDVPKYESDFELSKIIR